MRMTEEKRVVRSDDEGDAPDAKGAVEEEVEKIDSIKGSEVLGYTGGAREEHSGQNPSRQVPDPEGDLADHNPNRR